MNKLWFYLFVINSLNAKYEAVCIMPVANLFHPALHERYKKTDEATYDYLYEHFPLSTENSRDCLRIHQLLFNEVVTVVEEYGNEVAINIKNAFHQNRPWGNKEVTYWTLKRYLVPLNTIANKNAIPRPLDFTDLRSFHPTPKTIFTLTEPFFDTELKQTYSVRTRFVILNQTKTQTTVARYNPLTGSCDSLVIPINYGVINCTLSHKQAIEEIVGLLVCWASSERRFPSVRGGCSGCDKIEPGDFQNGSCKLPDESVITTHERSKCNAPYSGFDMPGLIMTGCQIFHVPYCAKNTLTAGRYLKHFNPQSDLLEVGDLIYSKGYFGMIADLEHNLIIEVRSHKFHQGTLQIVPLEQTFKGVTGYPQLLDRLNKKRELTLVDRAGNGILTLPFSILKLKSIFDTDRWDYPSGLF